MNISLAIAGVVAAGLGLLTMNVAFRPLPKPGVPVVISHSVDVPTPAAWRHTPNARPAVRTVSASHDEEAAPARRISRAPVVVRREAEAPPVEAPQEAAPAASPAPAAKPPVQVLAKADVNAEKLCKAPTPELLSAKALQPAMILRYDSRFKVGAPDIEPQRFSSDDEQRRIKLRALLSRVLEN